MKKYYFVLLLIFIFLKTIVSQNTVTLNFNATYNSNPINLDSIKIHNLTLACDTILYGFNTTLVLSNPSVETMPIGKNVAYVKTYPNPFTDKTHINISLTNKGIVHLKLYDVMGRVLNTFSEHLEADIHLFEIQAGKENIYFISIETADFTHTTKLFHIGKGKNQTENISYKNQIHYSNKSETNKAFFNWMPGNDLRFIGYSSVYTNKIGTDILFDAPINNHNYTFDIFPGHRCINQPYIVDSRDNSVYRTAQIGNQCWMAENLRYLPSVHNNTSYVNNSNNGLAGFGVYNYNGNDVNTAKATQNYIIFGVLYNWYAAMNNETSSAINPSGVQGICPTGWHLPSDAEWIQLTDYLLNGHNMPNVNVVNGAANGLKHCRQVGSPMGGDCNTSIQPRWNSHSSFYGNNTFGFSAIPSGYRDINGLFGGLGATNYIWTATENDSSSSIRRVINTYCGYTPPGHFVEKGHGASIRCVKD